MAKYLFSYFTNQSAPDGEQVRFARNRGDTPLEWEALNGGQPVLTWDGGRRGVRDPFLIRAAHLPGETANFYLIATDMRAHGQDTLDFWEQDQHTGSRDIVVWQSFDLITWSTPWSVTVSPPTAGNTWAPEATYDESTGRYFVYWASRLYEDESRTGDSYNRMLAATTTDFRTFTEPRVWADPGHSIIDATVVRHGGTWYRFIKDERPRNSDTPSGKYITVERSTELTGTSWEPVTQGVGRSVAGSPGIERGEGPIVVPHQDREPWYLFIDEFGIRGYVPFVGSEVETDAWRVAESYELPPGARHGSVLAITDDEWAGLAGV